MSLNTFLKALHLARNLRTLRDEKQQTLHVTVADLYLNLTTEIIAAIGATNGDLPKDFHNATFMISS